MKPCLDLIYTPRMDVLYIRVSSPSQNAERQLAALKHINTPAVFIDECSASSTNRPKLEQCLAYCRDGDLLHVYSIDRLARNLVDLRKIVTELRRNGISICFYKEKLSFGSSQSESINELLLNMLGAVAEFERSLVRERQSEGIEIAKKKGKYKGRTKILNSEQIEELNGLHEIGLSKTQIATKLGISRSSVYNYIKQKEILIKKKSLKEQLEDFKPTKNLCCVS